MAEIVSFNHYVPAHEFKVESEDREWGTETLVASTPYYSGKLLEMKAGTRGGLQCHVRKMETFFLFSGLAEVELGHGEGTLTVHKMLPGQSFHIPKGAHHRVTAIEDCVFFEASTPSKNDRAHVEHLYGLTKETGGLPSTWVTDDGINYRKVG